MLRKAKSAGNGRKSEKPGLESLLMPREMRLPKHLWRRAFGDKARIRPTTHFKRWQLQEAKARLSEVIKKAKKEGPQNITVHGLPTAVVISSKEYERLKHPRGSFVEFMRRSPFYGIDLDLKRDQTLTREAEIA